MSSRQTGAESRPLIRAVRRALKDVAEPERAAPMQAYAKSARPFLGVMAPRLRPACREAFDAHPLETFAAWRDTARALWRGARYHEELYAAIELTGRPRYREYRERMSALPLFEEMIVTGAWWDTVDAVATNRVGPILRLHPEAMKPRMRRWARGRDIWKRRTSIIGQLKFKAETDLALLYDCIEPSLGEKEFFLRKGIGWALREHAKTDPREVIRYVRENRDRLSPLSKREAVRNLIKAGMLDAVP